MCGDGNKADVPVTLAPILVVGEDGTKTCILSLGTTIGLK